MKTLILTIIFSIIFVFAVKGQSPVNWNNIGPGAGSDLHVLTFQPDNADIIYAGGDIEGVFKTTDGGQTWRNMNNNLAQTNYGGGIYWINDIVFDPANSEIVFLCTGAGIFKSTNGGDEWSELWVSMPDEEETISVSTIAIHPNNSDIMFMGLGDRAEGSKADYEPFSDYDAISGFFKTTNGGESWEEIELSSISGYNFHSIVFVDDNPDVILITTSKGVLKSIDSGVTWFEANSGLPHTNCHIMMGKDVGGKFKLFLTVKTLGDVSDSESFSGGLFRSDDTGETWVDITGDLPKYDAENMMFNDYWKFDVNPEAPETIYIATTRGSSWEISGIYVSRNTDEDDVNWELLYYPDLGAWLNNEWFGDPYAFDIRIAPTDTNRLIMCTVGVIISNDAGVSWEQSHSVEEGNAWRGNGLELMNTDCIAFHQSNPEIIYVGYDDMGLFRSEDGGNSFIRLDPKMDPEIGGLVDIDGVKDIEVDPDNGDLYISRWQGSQGGYSAGFTLGGIIISSDMGDTQTSISDGLPLGRCDLVLDKISGDAGSRILYTAVYNHGVYKTTNSGESWVAINEGLGENISYVWEITIDQNNPQILYLGLNQPENGGKSLFKSTNAGANWFLLDNFYEGDILSIKCSVNNKVFVSITDNFDWNYQGGLFVSDDGGDSWAELSTHIRIIDFDINPSDPDILIIANQQWYKVENEDRQGIYLSTDGGQNWENLTSTIGHTFFNFARFHTSKPNYIFTGTAGGGLWVSDSLNLEVTNVEDANHISVIEIYPNPFTDKINIELTINEAAIVKITIYNTLGERIKTLSEGFKGTGSYSFVFESGNLPQGIYYYTVQIGERIESGKLLLVK